MARLVLGSRGSALALAQVQLVRDALAVARPDVEIDVKIITTSGDRRQDVGAGEGNAAGLKGLFTKEIQDALLDRTIHAAVHSLKDLPGITPAELSLAAVLPRADTSDLLITHTPATLAGLPPGARIGTGSVRRNRQINWLRPGLNIVDLRGNVPTRLQKLASLDAIVLARAGLDRLGYKIAGGHFHCDFGSFYATPLDIIPAAGQGAIGLESRLDDAETRAILSTIDHAPTHSCIRVERGLLRLLEGDCRLPVGARASLKIPAEIEAEAIVFRDDPSLPPALAKAIGPATAPEALAHELFTQLSHPQ